MKASDEIWYKVCQAAHQQGLMRNVADSRLHKDREGHYITIGAGGVAAMAARGDRKEVQQFILTMETVNEHSDRLPGERDAFPYGGLLAGILVKDTGEVVMDLNQLTCVPSVSKKSKFTNPKIYVNFSI